MSACVHALLFGLLFLLSSPTSADTPTIEAALPFAVAADTPEETKPSDPLVTEDIDPNAPLPDRDINFDKFRKAPVSVPGLESPLEILGVLNAARDKPPVNLAPVAGLDDGQGGARQGPLPGSRDLPGLPGGTIPNGGFPRPGSFDGRGGATRDRALTTGGGTRESEVAVVAGLNWLKRNQASDGRWLLDGNFKDRGLANDIAGTAFGLLPLLGSGHTHKPAKNNDFDKPIEKALLYLIRKQDRRTGNFGGGMYAHGLATIAMCEAYGMTQDPGLRRSAQMAVNYIVRAQHSAGGWRYSPGQAGDTSVTGWQVMALKSAQMAGLDVPELAMKKAISYLNECCDSSEGYGYVGKGATPTMSAVGLLCRQYLQAWGPQNIRLIKGVDNHIKTTPPGTVKNMYYYYYATQVMHHFGGAAWNNWNAKMRDTLVKTQEKDGPNRGSWNSAGDAYSAPGGRLMNTSLSLLTLEVYYRHLPLYYREPMARK
jgi:hypothetical protein